MTREQEKPELYPEETLRRFNKAMEVIQEIEKMVPKKPIPPRKREEWKNS